MAITFDAASSSATKNITIHPTISHTIGSGSDRMLTGFANMEKGSSAALQTVSTFTYNGTPLIYSTRTTGALVAGFRTEAWYLGEASLPSGGAYNLICTWTANVQDSMVGCMTHAGVKDQAPEANGTGGTDIGTASGNVGVTTVTANAWVMGATMIGRNYTMSLSPATQRSAANTTGASGQYGDEPHPTTGAKTFDWSVSTSDRGWAGAVMAFEPAGGAVNRDVAVALVTLVSTTYNAVVNRGRSVDSTLVTLTSTTYNPDVNRRRVINASLVTFVQTSYNAVISRSRNVQASLVTLVSTVYNPLVNRSRTVDCSLVSLVSTNYNPVVNKSRTIDASLVTMAMTTYAVNVNKSRTVDAALTSMVMTPYNVTISTGLTVNVNVVNLTMTTYNATIGRVASVSSGTIRQRRIPPIMKNRRQKKK